ncbi:MAG: hypothetical protein HUK22_06220, partial [Thermoguttaceae bacterium]|nr:hypothetical protein [Thermoguttaceae bacterium]
MSFKTSKFRLWPTTLLGALAVAAGAFAMDFAAPQTIVAAEFAASVNGFHIADIKIENLQEPEGVDVAQPRISWKLFSQDLGVVQTAYQIVVSKAFGEMEQVWDSGKIESDEQLYIPYAGKALEPATEYAVELVVWDNCGRKSQNYTCFSTGLFPTDANPNPWRGKWIGLKAAADAFEPADISNVHWIAFENTMSLPVGFSVYRRSFEIADVDNLAAAIANFTGDNSCQIWVNGVNIGGTDDYRYASTRDLLPLLRNGANSIAIKVGNVGGNPNPGGLIGAFYIRDKYGATTVYETD